jgi:hypothetical protein
MNGNCGEDVGPKGEIGLILRGEDERITNRLAVTSLLYRFKVSLVYSMVPREGLVSSSMDRTRGSPTGWPSPHSPTDSRLVSSPLWDHQQAGYHLTPLQIQG